MVITARKRSLGQDNIFTPVTGEPVWQRGVCMVKGGHVWQGACMAGGCAWQGAMHGRGSMHGIGVCMAGLGHSWQGAVHGRGCVWPGGVCVAWCGACMAGGCA